MRHLDINDLVVIIGYPENLDQSDFDDLVLDGYVNPIGHTGVVAQVDMETRRYVEVTLRADVDDCWWYTLDALRPATDVEKLAYKLGGKG